MDWILGSENKKEGAADHNGLSLVAGRREWPLTEMAEGQASHDGGKASDGILIMFSLDLQLSLLLTQHLYILKAARLGLH